MCQQVASFVLAILLLPLLVTARSESEEADRYSMRKYHRDRSRDVPHGKNIRRHDSGPHSQRTTGEWGLPPCALDCEGLEGIDWENDRESCSFFSRKGYECLADCSRSELNMGGVSYRDVPRQCHWTLLGCPDLLFTSSPVGLDGDYCPDICGHTECLKTYEQLLVTKRQLDLHRRCAVNCRKK